MSFHPLHAAHTDLLSVPLPLFYSLHQWPSHEVYSYNAEVIDSNTLQCRIISYSYVHFMCNVHLKLLKYLSHQFNSVGQIAYVAKTYCQVRGVCVTDNNRFWMGWLDWLAVLLQLQQIITVHNPWLPMICSILTGLRGSSLLLWRMTNEESLATELSWTELTFRRTEYRSPSRTVRVFICYHLRFFRS
jgi:hypothetical protein